MNHRSSTLWPRIAALIAASLVIMATTAALAGFPNKRLSDEKRGEVLYSRHCVQCHGERAAGDGPATSALVAEVPDMRGKLDKDTLEDHTKIVLEGAGAMPAYANSFDRYDARRTLRHMRHVSLKTDEAEEEAEEPGEAAGDELIETEDAAEGEARPE